MTYRGYILVRGVKNKMQRILLVSGKKQSGKSSLVNFLTGLKMRENGVISAFDINDDGKLLVNTKTIDSDGKQVEGVGVLDIERRDHEFLMYAESMIWPHVKLYSFADELKLFLIRHFGLTVEQCYGTDEQKNTPTLLKWSDFAFVFDIHTTSELKKKKLYSKYMTGRDVMQVFGTDVCRRIFESCWAKPVMEQIMIEGSGLAIVSDARFISEIEMAKELGGKSIRLSRNRYEDTHASELALDNYSDYTAIIDNQNMSIREKNHAVFYLLREWGWIKGEL